MSTVKDDALLSAPAAAESSTNSRKYLIFMIHDEGNADLKLGVDAEYVVEILNSYNVTYLPMMPDYISGIFNMRGQIIPAMDIRLRLGKYSDENGLLIVLNYNGMQLGILADGVDRIIDIDNDTITTVSSQESQRFVSGMCTIPDHSGTLLVLNCDELFAYE